MISLTLLPGSNGFGGLDIVCTGNKIEGRLVVVVNGDRTKGGL